MFRRSARPRWILWWPCATSNGVECTVPELGDNGYLMSSPMIVLRNVEKYFENCPTKTFVLRRINVAIKEGEFVSVMGPSGAGKSTLLHLLGMHDSAWTGEYYLLDHAIHKINKKDRMELYKKYFGFVFQSYHLLDSLTV